MTEAPATPTWARALRWAPLVVLAFAAAFHASQWSWAYIDFGDGNYLYASARVRSGAMLYRDVLSPQPPVHTLIGVAALSFGDHVLGTDLWGVRLYSLLLRLATIALLAELVVRYARDLFQMDEYRARLLRLCVMTCVAIAPITLWWTRGFQTHPTVVMLQILLLFTWRESRWWGGLVGGIVTAIACQTSMTAVPFAMCWGLLTIVFRPAWGMAHAAAALGVWWGVAFGADALTGAYFANVIENQVGSFPREDVTGEPLYQYVLRKWFREGAKILSLDGLAMVLALGALAGVGQILIRRASWSRASLAPWFPPALYSVLWWGSFAFVAKGATADYIFTLGESFLFAWSGIGAFWLMSIEARCLRKTPGFIEVPSAGRRNVRTTQWMAALVALGWFVRWLFFVSQISRGQQDEHGPETTQRVIELVQSRVPADQPILAPPWYAFASRRRIAGEYAEIFLWNIKYWNETLLPEFRGKPPGPGTLAIRNLAGMLERGEIPLVLLDEKQTGQVPEIRAAIDRFYKPLFSQIGSSMNTPIQAYVPAAKAPIQPYPGALIQAE